MLDKCSILAILCLVALTLTLWWDGRHYDGSLYDIRRPSPHFTVHDASEQHDPGTFVTNGTVHIFPTHDHRHGRDILLVLDGASGSPRVNGKPWPKDGLLAMSLARAANTRLRVVNLTPHAVDLRARDRKMALIEVDAKPAADFVDSKVIQPKQTVSFQVDATDLPLAMKVIGPLAEKAYAAEQHKSYE